MESLRDEAWVSRFLGFTQIVLTDSLKLESSLASSLEVVFLEAEGGIDGILCSITIPPIEGFAK